MTLSQTIEITGKTVLLTGSTGYFGLCMAKTLVKAGANIVLLARDKEKLNQQSLELKKENKSSKVTYYSVDFYDRNALEKILKEISINHKIDCLVNNAYDLSKRTGFNTKKGFIENGGYEEWLSSFESGIYWPVLAIQIIGEKFRRNKSGSIINISSMYGIVSPDPDLYKGKKFLNPPSYGVTKAGLIALTRYLASFWGEYGIRCNAIVPGAFPNIDGSSSNSVKKEDNFLNRLKAKTVLGRVGIPEDLSGALIFLVSNSSSYMTGNILTVDGGWTTK